MGSVRNEKGNLASFLREWAVDEMRFHTTSYNRTSLPTEEDFERLCRRPLSNVWKFMVEHIRSADYVKQVKGNLLLQKKIKKQTAVGTQDNSVDENENLRRRKQRLEANKSSVMADVTAKEKEMKQISKLLEDATLVYEKSAMQLRNLQRKKCLLKVVCRRADEKVAEYSEYVNRLDAHSESVKNKRKEADKNNYMTGVGQDSQTDLETESCRDVRLVCRDISQYLHTALVTDADRHIVEDNRLSVLEGVEDLHDNYSIYTVTDSLATHTVRCAKLLREDTVKVNIASDTKDLSFSMDNKGRLHDESKPPSVQKSVQKLLQASNLNHVMRWFEEQNYLNESWKIEAQLDNMKSEIHKLIVKAMGGNPDNVRQAEVYAEMLLLLASERAVAPCLKQEMEILLNRIGKAKAERDELRYKFGKIEEFKALVEKKQYFLGSLARYNSDAPKLLQRHKEQCKSYLATRPVHHHLDLVEKVTSDLFGSLQKEVIKFHPLPFVCFLSANMNSGLGASLLDLSIAPSALPGAQGYLQTYTLLCQALHYPLFKSPDQMLTHILQLQSSIQDAHLSQVKISSDRKAMCKRAGVQDDAQSHRDLIRRSEEQDSRLQESVLPQLSRLEGLAQKWGRKVTENIPVAMEAWWEQPAQYTTPWVSVEGLTFDQWMQRFRVIITQVHKKHMEKHKGTAE